MEEMFKELVDQCNELLVKVNREKEEEEKRKKEEEERREEEERKKREEEERKRKEEEERLEKERREKEEAERRAKEEEDARQKKRAEELLACQEAQQRMDKGEEERRHNALLEKQKAILETLRLQREAKQKAKEEEARRAEEQERQKKEAACLALEQKWISLQNEEKAKLPTLHWKPSVPSGVEVGPSGMWTLQSARDFDSIIHNHALLGLCVYWHNSHLEKSVEIMQTLEKAIPRYPEIRFLTIDTSLFPQLIYRCNASLLNIQCFLYGDLHVSSSATKEVQVALREFALTVESHRAEHLLRLTAARPGSRDRSAYVAAIHADSFGMSPVTDELRLQLRAVIDALCRECGDAARAQGAMEVGEDERVECRCGRLWLARSSSFRRTSGTSACGRRTRSCRSV